MLSWLELPLILVMLILFSTGLAMLLSAMFVRFRDIQPIGKSVSQIVFYGSPVIIPITTVRAKLIIPPHDSSCSITSTCSTHWSPSSSSSATRWSRTPRSPPGRRSAAGLRCWSR